MLPDNTKKLLYSVSSNPGPNVSLKFFLVQEALLDWEGKSMIQEQCLMFPRSTFFSPVPRPPPRQPFLHRCPNAPSLSVPGLHAIISQMKLTTPLLGPKHFLPWPVITGARRIAQQWEGGHVVGPSPDFAQISVKPLSASGSPP